LAGPADGETPATKLKARKLNRNVAKAKRQAASGPVLITSHGSPTHVLMTYADYRRLAARPLSLLEALAEPPGLDFDFVPPRLRDDLFEPVDFD
jgi:prevent-host-death family protein